MNEKKRSVNQQIISMILVVLMAVSIFPVHSFAAVPVESISLGISDVTLEVGETYQFKNLKYEPNGASLVWDYNKEIFSFNQLTLTLKALKPTTEDEYIFVKDAQVSDENLEHNISFDYCIVKVVPETHTITATADIGGTVSGGGSFKPTDKVTLTATPYSTTHNFDGWYEANTLVYDDARWEFFPTRSMNLTARFYDKKTQYKVTINKKLRERNSTEYKTANNNSNLYINGSGSTSTLAYSAGSMTTTLKATVKSNYDAVFEGWYENGVLLSTDSNFLFKIRGDRTLEARFKSAYQLKLSVYPSSYGGYIEGDGEGYYDYDDKIELEAVPDDDYKFDGWYESSTKISSAKAKYSFNIKKARTLQARFVKKGTTTSSGSGGSGTTPTVTTPTTTTTKKKTTMPVYPELTREKAVSSTKTAVAAAKKANQSTATVKIQDIGLVKMDTFKAIQTEAGMPVKFQADTMTATGKGVDARITVDPSKVTKDLTLSVSKSNDYAEKTKAFFAKWFSNKTQVFSLGQTGGFGCQVEIAAKITFTGMNKNNLYFYCYDAKKNTYKRITPSKHWIDANGYLHIVTSESDNIVVSDGLLKKKK